MLFGRASFAARGIFRSVPRLRANKVANIARISKKAHLLEQRCALIRTTHMLSSATLTGDKQLLGRNSGASATVDLELDEEDRLVSVLKHRY